MGCRQPDPIPRYVLTIDGVERTRGAWPVNLCAQISRYAGCAYLPTPQVTCGVWRVEYQGRVYEITRLADAVFVQPSDRAIATCLDGPCVGELYEIAIGGRFPQYERCGADGALYGPVQGESGEWWLVWCDTRQPG